MERCIPLKPSSPGAYVQVKLPPVKWINFNMHEIHFLGKSKFCNMWSSTWKAILLASGIPHDGSTNPARFMLSEHDDYALAVLLRTTIDFENFPDTEDDIIRDITGKRIFSVISRVWEKDEEAIQILYPCELSKKEVAKFTVRGEPLEVVEYKVKTQTETEDKTAEIESEVLSAIKELLLRLNDSSTS